MEYIDRPRTDGALWKKTSTLVQQIVIGGLWGEVSVIYTILNVRWTNFLPSTQYLPSTLHFISTPSMKNISLSVLEIRGKFSLRSRWSYLEQSSPVFCFTFFGIAQVSTIARLWIRYRSKRLWWDDFCKCFFNPVMEFNLLNAPGASLAMLSSILVELSLVDAGMSHSRSFQIEEQIFPRFTRGRGVVVRFWREHILKNLFIFVFVFRLSMLSFTVAVW